MEVPNMMLISICQDCKAFSLSRRGQEFSIECKSGHSPDMDLDFSIKVSFNNDYTNLYTQKLKGGTN